MYQNASKHCCRILRGQLGLAHGPHALVVRRGVHEQHDEQHDVAGEASGLGVVDSPSRVGSDLGQLNVDEVDCVVRSARVRTTDRSGLSCGLPRSAETVRCARRTDREEQKRIGDLPVEPDRLVERHEPASISIATAPIDRRTR